MVVSIIPSAMAYSFRRRKSRGLRRGNGVIKRQAFFCAGQIWRWLMIQPNFKTVTVCPRPKRRDKSILFRKPGRSFGGYLCGHQKMDAHLNHVSVQQAL